MVLKRFVEYFTLIILLFAFSFPSPYLVCVGAFFLLLNKMDVSERSLVTVIVLSAILIGAVNAVKVPDNDLVTYLEMYHMAKDMPISQYIWVVSAQSGVENLKEPLYSILVWFLNKLCFDNEVLFKFIFSIINYSLLNTAILIVGQKNKIDSKYILFGMFLMTFIPFIFTLSLHAMRQFIAGAWFMVILSLKCFSNTKQWKLIVMSIFMVLLHTTSLLFLPFLFLKAFDKNWKEAKIWYLGLFIGLVLIRVLSVFLLGFMGLGEESGLAGYALSRAAQESGYDVDAIPLIGILLTIVIVCLSYYYLYNNSIKDNKGIRRFYNIPFFIGLFVLINLSMKEMALRFLFYLYFFVPFVLMFFAHIKKIKSSLLVLMSLAVMLYFLFYLEYGVWTYEIPYTVFFTPLFAYLYS